MVNPLETSIKKNQVQAATLLVKEFGINPIACFSSDYSKSLLELAACYSFETFNGLVETLDAKDLKDVQLLKTLMKLFELARYHKDASKLRNGCNVLL
jgi:hypothetical protein